MDLHEAEWRNRTSQSRYLPILLWIDDKEDYEKIINFGEKKIFFTALVNNFYRSC